ncbi:MAG: V-type ATP synthase subunit I [Clostridia bacterium]|nr:V-type ATP synthase subunit I [Clostridia bacterium]
MAILPMRRVTIYGLKKDRKAILEALQRSAVVEVDDIKAEEYGLEKWDTSASQALFSKGIQTAETALEILESYVASEKESLFSGRRELSVDDYYTFVDETDEIMRVASAIISLSKDISEQKSEIIRAENQVESLMPWLSLDVPMNYQGTKKTAAFIGTFPEKRTLEAILSEYKLLAEKSGYDDVVIDVNIISASPEQTCVLVFCLRKMQDKVEELLRSLGFARPALSYKVTPSERKLQLESEISEAKRIIEKKENEIKSYAGMRNALKFMADYYTMRVDRYKVLSQVNQDKHIFAVSGYVPEKDASKLERMLVSDYNAAVEIESVGEDEDVPILLKNNAFAAPVEPVLESYSMPGKGEVDPSTVMAMFYYVLFGLMLSDAAYGIIMVLGCGIVLSKFKNIEDGLKKTLKMFLYSGISTTFWGLMFGSFFGDAVSVVSSTFFGKEIAFEPIWFSPVDEPMRMLMFSFALGIIHIFVGLGMKFYQLCRSGSFLDAVYDVVFWVLLVGGGIVYLLTMPMFINMAGLTFTLPPIAGKTASICALVGALGIIFTGGRESKSFIKRIMKGLYALYNVTGYLSDILSYSRLLALGLATGVIATVFNKMGSMVGGGVVGAVVFVLVFIIGHTLNIGINLLGAYVHTNRLQFVEFFGKFYEGGGRKYSPFSVNTKYFKFREDM